MPPRVTAAFSVGRARRDFGPLIDTATLDHLQETRRRVSQDSYQKWLSSKHVGGPALEPLHEHIKGKSHAKNHEKAVRRRRKDSMVAYASWCRAKDEVRLEAMKMKLEQRVRAQEAQDRRQLEAMRRDKVMLGKISISIREEHDKALEQDVEHALTPTRAHGLLPAIVVSPSASSLDKATAWQVLELKTALDDATGPPRRP